MDIAITTKFNKGDKVIIRTRYGQEEHVVFVLAEIDDVKQITRMGSMNQISYEAKAFKLGEGGHRRTILVDEQQLYTLEEFGRLFENVSD